MVVCSQLKEDISAYLDDELSSDAHTQVSEHLSNCSHCQEACKKIKQTTALLSKTKLITQAKCPDIWEKLSCKLPSICEVVKEDFSAYLDGELVVTAREGINEHLQGCPTCHEQFQGLSKINGWLTKGLELPANVELNIWSGVKDRLSQDCTVIRDELSSFYDREVTGERHRDMTSHVLECNPCRQQLAKISHMSNLLREYYQPVIGENFDLWTAIKAKMKILPFAVPAKRRQAVLQRRLYAVSAVFLGGLVAVLFLTNTYFHTPSIQPTSAESYLIESALGEPINIAEAIIYDY